MWLSCLCMYILCVYYVYIMCILCVYYVYIMCILCVYYVYIMCILCVYLKGRNFRGKIFSREDIFAEESFAVEDSKSSEIRGIYFRVACP